MKRLSLLLLSAFSLIQAQISFAPGISQASLAGKKIVIAWDLNDVVFTVNKSQIAKHVLLPWKWKKACRIAAYQMWRSSARQNGQDEGHVLEAMIEKENPDNRMKQYYCHAMGTKILKANQPVVSLLRQLKAKGHTNSILSNMGTTIWDYCLGNNTYLSPLFDLPNRCVAHKKPNGRWYYKPQKEYYDLFVQKNKKDNNTIIVFIDDDARATHISTALQNGIDVAIKFSNVNQLEKDFRSLGLL